LFGLWVFNRPERGTTGSVSTRFHLLGPNDKIVVDGFDDPKVEGVACHISRAQTGSLKGGLGVDSLLPQPSPDSRSARAFRAAFAQYRLQYSAPADRRVGNGLTERSPGGTAFQGSRTKVAESRTVCRGRPPPGGA
jgi:hypothetical protein